MRKNKIIDESEKLKSYKEVVLEAIKELKFNPRFEMKKTENYERFLSYIGENLKSDKNFIFELKKL